MPYRIRLLLLSLGMSLCLKIRGWHAHCAQCSRAADIMLENKAHSILLDTLPSLNKLWWLVPSGKCHSWCSVLVNSPCGPVEVVDVLCLAAQRGPVDSPPALQWRWGFLQQAVLNCPWCPSVRHSNRSNVPRSFLEKLTDCPEDYISN